MSESNPLAAKVAALEAENVRLRRGLEELSFLNELAIAVGGSRDSEQIMRRIVRQSVRMVGAEQGLITLVDLNQENLTETLVRTVSDSSEQAKLSPSESVVGWMLTYQKPLVVNDPDADERFQGATWRASVRSLVAVPMLAQGRLIGILTLYNKKSDDGFSDQDQRILSILSAQSAQFIENARLYEEEQQLGSLREQLELARKIQIQLLPEGDPEIDGYDIAGLSRPAQSVGGDFYDILEIDESIVFWIGDVSGKGLPASLTMANSQAALLSHASTGRSIVRAVSETNKLLTRFTPKGTFVTLVAFKLDKESGALDYVNAGHVRPILVRADGAVEQLEQSNLVLGFARDMNFVGGSTTLNPGDVLVNYTDGISEAMNSDRYEHGDETAVELAQHHRQETASGILKALIESVDNHADGVEQHDDVSALILKRN